ncbi:cold regulated gene 27 [Striga asiatica]|uniref:Cold regulated gene 27 n=1 Tax=Striga asiatica TaxID=4170 RepID=A0A5A7QB85_STRAF|nr:cold regulated gene 27 [Striga asiatica]
MNTKTLARANREKYLAGIGGRYYPTWHRPPTLTCVKSASKVEPLASVSSRGFFSFFSSRFFLSFSPDFFVSFLSFPIQISAVTHFYMLRVEEDFRPEALRRPLPSEADVACDRELTRSRSGASSFTAEDCKAVVRSSEDVAPDDGTAWTDEKHNLYLHDLEVSFAEQLYHSKALLWQCSDQNLRDVNISQKRLADVKNASEQFKVLQNNCLRKTSYVKGGPLFGSSSADLSTPFTSTRGYNLKNNCYLPSAEWAASRDVWSALKHLKGTISHRLGTCSQEYSSSDQYLGDSFDLQREGTGQNFPDEGTSNFEPQAKRSKNAVAESSLQDQIVPSSKCPTANYPGIGSSNLD